MKGMRVLALALVIGALSPASLARSEPAAIGDEQKASYPRIGQSDLHNILLKNAIQSWNDELLALHLYGSPAPGGDGFAKRDQQQLNLAKAAEARATINAQPLKERFRIGFVNVSTDRYTTGLGGYGMPSFRRFRQMRGYHEDDLTTNMSLDAFDFNTGSFSLTAPFLPCDSRGTGQGRFGSLRRIVIYRIQKWDVPSDPRRSHCVIRIDDQKTARKIEEARHQGKLVIGATVYARYDEAKEGESYVLYADRIEVDFYRNDGGKGTYPRLGGVSLSAPESLRTDVSGPSHASAPNARGLDLSDPEQAEVCAHLCALTQTMAEQAAENRISGRQTTLYATLSKDMGELADVMAKVVDQLSNRMRPHLIRAWSMWGYCIGLDDDLLFGEAATKAAAACNGSSPEMAGKCINDLLRGNFDALPLAEREKYIEAARQRGY